MAPVIHRQRQPACLSLTRFGLTLVNQDLGHHPGYRISSKGVLSSQSNSVSALDLESPGFYEGFDFPEYIH